jgi:molecular chaperone GrpE
MGEKSRVKIRTENEEIENEKIENENDSLPEADSGPEDHVKPDDPLAELEAQLESAQKDYEEVQDRLLRVSAEFENYKKRSAREMADFRKFANEALIKGLLPVVDNLERALDSVNNDQLENNPIAEGVLMTLSEILKTFEQFQVKQVESMEKPFDPAFHQAVMQEENGHYPDKTVLRELQKGYVMHDKLIRPAMVVVSKREEASENHDDQGELENTPEDNT